MSRGKGRRQSQQRGCCQTLGGRPCQVILSQRDKAMLNRTQQSPFGLGQGSLPGGNRQPTQRAGQPPTSPGQTTMRAASFPMGAAAAALSPQSGESLRDEFSKVQVDPLRQQARARRRGLGFHPLWVVAGSTRPSPSRSDSKRAAIGQPELNCAPAAGATLPPGINSASLDPSDFPALGAQPASSGGLGSSSAASLFSSYASQAGQSSLSPGALNGAPGTATGGAPGSRRDFSADDFPVLGGAGAFGSAGQQLPPPSQHHQQQSQGMTNAAPGGGLNDLAGLSAGINGMSLAAAAAAAGRAVASPGGQEQASALAALQAQQQHRANLLGSMNGPRNPPVDKQVRTRVDHV